MQKRMSKMIALLLVLCIMICCVPLSTSAKTDEIVFKNDTFTMYKDGDYYRFVGPTGELSNDFSGATATISSADDYYKAHKTNKKDISKTGGDSLPKSVDLSQSKYFPPIGNQGGLGSCATFSSVYYQFSYAVNENLDVTATAKNTRSPQIVYNFVNAGGNTGTFYGDNYDFLKDFGAPTLATVPYTDQDDKNWYANDGVWREAIRTRLKDYYVYEDIGKDDKQITSADDPDLVPYKTALNDGKVLGYSTFIYSWKSTTLKTNPLAPENYNHQNEQVVTVCDGTNGGHAMTLVGYNDDIWTDINNNDKVDSGEMGAFKIANSWGEGYCNGGFAWVAYDALNKVSSVDGVNFPYRYPIFEYVRSITVRDYNDLSDFYIQYTLNTAKRTQHKVEYTAEKDGTINTYQMFYGCGGGYTSASIEGAFDGTDKACDGTFVCPLDLIVKDITYDDFENYNWSVKFSDTLKDSNPLTIKDVRLVNEKTGQSYVVPNAANTVIDGDSASFDIKNTSNKNMVIYYIGYDNPTLHYKESGSDFVSVKMDKNYERIGATHKYIIENVDNGVSVYFSDENGNIDDNLGKYYKASDRLNFYRTYGVKEKLELTDIEVDSGEYPDINQRFFFKPITNGGYPNINDRYVIENLDTGEIKTIEYVQPYEKSHAFYNEGKYRVTGEVMDQSGDTATLTKVMDIKNQHFKFDSLTYDKNINFVGDTMHFESVTKYEGIISYAGKRSLYLFEVKDEKSETVYSETKKSDQYSMVKKTSNISFDYVPEKAGNYTLTISSTDISKEYAELSTAFTVSDKIYGDANADAKISILDATTIQLYCVHTLGDDEIKKELADCNSDDKISILDATHIQLFVAALDDTGRVGETVVYTPPVKPTEPTTPTQNPTDPPTAPPTDPPTDPPVSQNKVTFTNSFRWSGTIYCYYWADGQPAMTSWPGVAMTFIGVNDFGESLYTFEVPKEVTHIIFSNGSSQTTNIKYDGGETRYYPISTTDSNGHNLVNTW